jgi:hypothetical protein
MLSLCHLPLFNGFLAGPSVNQASMFNSVDDSPGVSKIKSGAAPAPAEFIARIGYIVGTVNNDGSSPSITVGGA